jgi:hypothetical protein
MISAQNHLLLLSGNNYKIKDKRQKIKVKSKVNIYIPPFLDGHNVGYRNGSDLADISRTLAGLNC